MKQPDVVEMLRKKQLQNNSGVFIDWDKLIKEVGVPIFPEITLSVFPKDLSSVTDKELGVLYSEYTAYLAYLNQEVAKERWQLKRLKLKLRNLFSQKLFMATGAFKAKQFAKVNCDCDIKNVRNELLVQEARTVIIRSLLWTILQFLKALEFESKRRAREYFKEDL